MKSSKGFLRVALTGHGHPGPVWKIAKMALFDACIEFEIFLGQMTSFEVLWKCHCLRLHPAPSKCLSERIIWIISRIPRWISKIILSRVPMNPKQCWKAKLERAYSFRVQSGKITVCNVWLKVQLISEWLFDFFNFPTNQ